MKKTLQISLGLLLAAIACAPAWSDDRVRLKAGNEYPGKLVETSPTKVTLEIGATRREFDVNAIETVQFDAEPTELTQARAFVRSGRYVDAGRMLAKVTPTEMRRMEIARDVEFYRSLAAARHSLAGGSSIANAGKMMFNFVRANANSYHYFEACEVLGDLLAALENYAAAESYYGKVAAAPWPEYKLKAAVLMGRAQVGQKKYEAALERFDSVLSSREDSDEAKEHKAAARLGKASALAGSGRSEEAVALIDDIIAQADPKDEALHARAYNLLGSCHQAAGQTQPAILAYLHVDLLYSRFPELHAEALSNLVKLFEADNKASRADEARRMLKDKYPNSSWASK
ncbi:MAG: hypothetical protein DWQ37_07670 [Planctomycetota bacterium]|nr:MAG: hypothetical protein DWQ37_07670 [Planctomycetota bacterium]